MKSGRVVVTGLGAVTPVGNDVASTWKAVAEGRSGIARITHFDASFFSSQIAGEVKNFDFSPWLKQYPHLAKAMSNTRFAIAACEEALRDSGLDFQRLNPRRTGIYFAAGDSGADLGPLAKVFRRSYEGNDGFRVPGYVREALRDSTSFDDIEQEPFMTLRHLVQRFGVEGPAFNCLTACAASAQGIGEGAEMIRRGQTDVMLCGGSHSMIHPFGLVGFCLLSTLSTTNDSPETASRPFDETRNGFVLSEGSGAVLLEEFDHARLRGAPIYGELVGYGSTADAYRLTDSHPEGLGAISAMVGALKSAGLSADAVDYLNAHGTSTKVNDIVETVAIKKVFGSSAKALPVSSTKSMTGHLIAAAGVVELQFCLLAMRDNLLPPTINYHHRDPECDLDYVPNEPRSKKVRAAMTNSFGFGGQNIVLVAKRI